MTTSAYPDLVPQPSPAGPPHDWRRRILRILATTRTIAEWIVAVGTALTLLAGLLQLWGVDVYGTLRGIFS